MITTQNNSVSSDTGSEIRIDRPRMFTVDRSDDAIARLIGDQIRENTIYHKTKDLANQYEFPKQVVIDITGNSLVRNIPLSLVVLYEINGRQKRFICSQVGDVVYKEITYDLEIQY